MLGRQERDLSLVTGLWPGFVTYPDASGCVHIEMSGHDDLKTLLQVAILVCASGRPKVMSIMSRLLRLLQEHPEWFRLLYLQIAAMAGGDCWAAGPGLLGSQVPVPVLSGCWAAGLSGCWALAGLPGCWAAGLAACCCWASGLLGCWAAGLLLAAGL